jgi:hypothetical protein
VLFIVGLFYAPCSWNHYTALGGCCQVTIRNLKIFKIGSRYPYLNGPFYVI